MYLIPSICNTFCEVQGKREQSPLLGSDTYPPLHTEGPFRHTQTLRKTHNTAFFRLTQFRTHATHIQEEEDTKSKKANI